MHVSAHLSVNVISFKGFLLSTLSLCRIILSKRPKFYKNRSYFLKNVCDSEALVGYSIYIVLFNF